MVKIQFWCGVKGNSNLPTTSAAMLIDFEEPLSTELAVDELPVSTIQNSYKLGWYAIENG